MRLNHRLAFLTNLSIKQLWLFFFLVCSLWLTGNNSVHAQGQHTSLPEQITAVEHTNRAPQTIDYAHPSWFMGSFYTNLQKAMKNILSKDSRIVKAADMLYQLFAIIIIINLMVRFAFSGVSQDEILFTILLLAMVRVLMNQYDVLTSAIWSFGLAIADDIFLYGIGVQGQHAFFVSDFIVSLLRKISFAPFSLWTVKFEIVTAFILFTICGVMLALLSFFASAWALWGYAVAKMIGYLFVPMILFERLSFIFDGWVRFFLGFIVYMIIARANMALIVLVLKAYFSISSTSFTPTITKILKVTNTFEIVGILGMLLIGIVALLSTAQFAATISGGVTGMGGGIRSIAGAAFIGGKAGKAISTLAKKA